MGNVIVNRFENRYFPTLAYTRSRIDSTILHAVRNDVDAIRLFDENVWMAYTYRLQPGADLSVASASCCFDRMNEFCGGGMLHGVNIRADTINTEDSPWGTQRWRPINEVRGLSDQHMFYINGDGTTAEYILRTHAAGECPLPDLNVLLGKDSLSSKEVKEYLEGSIAMAIVAAMVRNGWRRVLAADKVSGGLSGVMNWMLRNGCNPRGTGAKTYSVDNVLPSRTLRVPTNLLRSPPGRSAVYVSGVKVRQSAEFVNVNSRNTCRTYSVEISEVDASARASDRGADVLARLLDITAPWHEDVNLPTIGATRYTALSCHVPLRMPPGRATTI